MSTYKYFKENCALCGEEFPIRDLRKLMLSDAHTSVPKTRKLCGVCDDCLPKLLDFLEVTEPEDRDKRPYTPRQLCRKCYNWAGKTAKFCPYCGDELASQTNKEI